MAPRRPQCRNDEEPLPPPSLAHVLATMEGNRVRTEQILERLVQNQKDRKSTRLNSSHSGESRMPSSA